MFTFSITYQNSLCVFLSSNKQIEHISFSHNAFEKPFFKNILNPVLFASMFHLLAILFLAFVCTFLRFLAHYGHL